MCRFQLRPGINSAVLLLCKHTLLRLQLILRDASCLEKCLPLAMGWHAKILSPVCSESIRKSVTQVPGLRMPFQNRIDLPFISPPILLTGEINNASSCLWSMYDGTSWVYSAFSQYVVVILGGMGIGEGSLLAFWLVLPLHCVSVGDSPVINELQCLKRTTNLAMVLFHIY